MLDGDTRNAADGTFSYTLTNGTFRQAENFTDSFTYEVSDAVGNTDTATVTITITPVNDNALRSPTPKALRYWRWHTATEADLDVGSSLAGR